MTDIILTPIDHVFCKVVALPHILQEIRDLFTKYADNYKFAPKYRAGIWDGTICLVKGSKLFIGLVPRLQQYALSRDYTIQIHPSIIETHNLSVHEFEQFVSTLELPANYQPRDYQIKSTIKALRNRRQVIQSPTSSGKSLIIYMMIAYCLKHSSKALIIVPTIGLVNQMKNDFSSYNSKLTVHCSTDKLEKDPNIQADVVISTWQSISNGKNEVSSQWYKQFDIVVIDECHIVNQGSKAKTLVHILSQLTNCKWRFGTTGTLTDNELNNLSLEALLGPVNAEITTKQMIDGGYASRLRIKCIVLSYPEHIRKKSQSLSHAQEIDFIAQYKPRNMFIKNLALSLLGNVLVFFRLREKHGHVLRDVIGSESTRPIYYIDGEINSTEREQIRSTMLEQNNAILIASLGTTSTGISINTLKHMIAASPSKSKVKVLQSIGRMLRLAVDKHEAILYDIVDDMSYNGYENYTLKHFRERLKLFNQESFPYKIYTVELK